MTFLNYHHLRYFHAVAKEGNLTRAAGHLRISQSALSLQLKKLEESLGTPLFSRTNKRLELTEAGRIALDYAEQIFRAGEELKDTLLRGGERVRRVLRAGSVATLSRNFQRRFFEPLIHREDCGMIIHSGPLQDLLNRLRSHTLDLVLSNVEAPRDGSSTLHSHLLATQPVSLVGPPDRRRKGWSFPASLGRTPLLIPGMESNIRTAFDRLMDSSGLRPMIAAEVDDMAMMRLLARDSRGLALVPPVVVQEELASGALVEYHRFREISETFFAITPSRRFPNPITRELMDAWKRNQNKAPKGRKSK